MNRKLVAGLVAATVVILAVVGGIALLGGSDKSAKLKGTDPASPIGETFKPGGTFTVTVTDEAYFTLTNDGAKAPSYLEFKPQAPVPGLVSIERCSKPFAASGKCGDKTLTVLPRVDLGGWKNFLAGANTALNPKETGYYHIKVDAQVDRAVVFDVRAKSGK